MRSNVEFSGLARLFAQGPLERWVGRCYLISRKFSDFANCPPITISHRNTEQFFGACRELGSTHSFRCIEIEHVIAEMKPFSRFLEAGKFL